MKTLEQLLTIGSYAGLGLLLNCTADNESKPTDSDTEYVSDDSGSESCVAWEQTYGGSENDYINSAQQTTDGGYILAGHTSSSGSGDSDGWVVKIDKNGNKEWEQTYGGSGVDRFYSVQQTTDGGYVLAGTTESSGAGDYDGWVVKIDKNGSKQWEQTFGGSEIDEIRSVQQTTDGGYVLAGRTSSSGAGSGDGWLIKIDENGNKEWEQTYGGSELDKFYSVQQTTDEGYIMVGYTESSGAGKYDGWFIKTDKNGNKEWEQTYGGREDDELYSIQQTTDRGYVLAGAKYSDDGSSYGWFIKTDENGNPLWEQTYGESDYNYIFSLQQTSDEGYILAGMAGYTGYYDERSSEGWLIKTDANGSMLWEQKLGGSDNDSFSSVQQIADGSYILAGYTESSGISEGWFVKTCDKS